MIKSILVCTDGSSHSQTACEYALALASQLEARLIGLHVLDSRMLEGPLMADISGWIGAQPYGAQLQQFRELLQERGEAVLQSFRDLCAQRGVSGEALMRMGHPSRVILEEEAKAELVVLGQKGEHVDMIGDLMGSNAERVARHSVKPCMITPSEFRPIRKILAAYDGSAHASKAVHEAVELAQAARMDLAILAVADRDNVAEMQKVLEDARRLAAAHGLDAPAIVKEGDVVDTLLAEAEAQNSDLIVVGAYGHSRIREMILGSTTTQIMSTSKRPVLLVR